MPQESLIPTPPTLEYPPLGKPGDEVHGVDGSVKPHWQYVMDSFSALPLNALQERQNKASRLLRDDGASYNVYSDEQSSSRHWGLDLVPNIISSENWGDIEAALLERSELFNMLLRDIYGPRQLIRTGVIPPEAIYAHRGFLRACQGIKLPGDHELITHAVDMIRGADGRMIVLADRTQSPSGTGYALENRTVMSRVLPSMFRDSHVHRLAGYFQQLRTKLLSLCPHRANPRVAVLTPGPRNETYFEHAYLANYLGFYLVQSDDLVVRGGFLWMKSLDGLNRVDVVLRRVDDSYCDPVELRSDSRLGVPGMLDVVRAGNVVVANSLGSGILENPVLLKYLPDISRALLGRELRMDSVTTYWCGDEADLSYVLAHLDRLVVKSTYRKPGQFSTNGTLASAAELEKLRAAILANPMNYVAQPILSSNFLPTFDNEALSPRPAILRSFTVAGAGSYSVMPGGLTRVGNEDGSFIISSQVGASSKDTWVVASEPQREMEKPPEDTLAARDSEIINLPSRVLENLFWMGRYAERAEACLRILRTTYRQLNGEDPLSSDMRVHLLDAVSKLASVTVTEVPESDRSMISLLREGTVPAAIAGVLNSMLFCAEEAKELLSSDTYRVINDIRDSIPLLDTELGDHFQTPDEVLDPLVTALMALAGLNHESMTRGYGWRFMDLGRRLERAVQTANLTECLLVPELPEPDQSRIAEAMLIAQEGLISYRRRYGARPDVTIGLNLVLLDPDSPRSVMYQLTRMVMHLRKLPKGSSPLHEMTPIDKALLECTTQLRLASLTELAHPSESQRQNLSKHMQSMSESLMSISEMISDRYFDHREASQQLVSVKWEGL